MTEHNEEPRSEAGREPERAAGPGAPPAAAGTQASRVAGTTWPALPSELASADPSGKQQVQDPAVNAVLERLAAVRLAPVSGHAELYAGMHDALLEALNEDVASQAGVAHRIHAAGNGGA